MFREFVCPDCRESLQNVMNAMCEAYGVHEIVCDDNGKPVNYKFLEINNAFEEITGFRRADVLGKTVKDVFPDIDQYWIDIYGSVALTGKPESFEHYARVLGKHFRVNVFSPQKGKFITLFIDITEFKKSQEVLQKHKLLFECAQDAVLYVRSDGKIEDANDSASRLYGYKREELLNLSIHNIRHPSTRARFEQQMVQADDSGVVFESIHIRKDGSELPVEVSAKGTIIGNEKVRIHIIRDITERKITEERCLYLANHDSLTGIPNRSFLMNELDRYLELAGRKRTKLAVMLFDIDKFKLINDVHGHQAGDIVLKTVAARIKAVVRNVDVLGRLGGDEFLIILPVIENKNDAAAIVNRMFGALLDPVTAGDVQLAVKISVGIGVYPDDALDIEGLIKCSDASMYEAKKVTGNSYYFYGD